MNDNQQNTKPVRDDGSVNELAVKVAHHPEPVIKGTEIKHLGKMLNDGQVKRRVTK